MVQWLGLCTPTAGGSGSTPGGGSCKVRQTKQNKTKTVDFGILQTHLFLQRKYKTECSIGLQLRKKKNSSWARIPEAEHRPRSLRPHGKQHLPPFREKTNCTGDPSTAPQMSLLPSGEAESYSHKINNCLQIFPLALMV